MAPFQKRPVRDWSGVAVVLLAIPRDFTSLNASLNASLSNAGGGHGRNCLPLSSAKGVTRAQWVNWGCFGKLGGVDWYCPGAGGFVKTNGAGVASDPSLFRRTRILFATVFPTLMPSLLLALSGTEAKDCCSWS